LKIVKRRFEVPSLVYVFACGGGKTIGRLTHRFSSMDLHAGERANGTAELTGQISATVQSAIFN
jgi:uncharacterized metal-binding protein